MFNCLVNSNYPCLETNRKASRVVLYILRLVIRKWISTFRTTRRKLSIHQRFLYYTKFHLLYTKNICSISVPKSSKRATWSESFVPRTIELKLLVSCRLQIGLPTNAETANTTLVNNISSEFLHATLFSSGN